MTGRSPLRGSGLRPDGLSQSPLSQAEPLVPNAVRLTKGQAAFFRAVASGQSQMFHRSVIEPVERLGLVKFEHLFRLAGCNSFSSSRFSLTEAGEVLAVTP